MSTFPQPTVLAPAPNGHRKPPPHKKRVVAAADESSMRVAMQTALGGKTYSWAMATDVRSVLPGGAIVVGPTVPTKRKKGRTAKPNPAVSASTDEPSAESPGPEATGSEVTETVIGAKRERKGSTAVPAVATSAGKQKPGSKSSKKRLEALSTNTPDSGVEAMDIDPPQEVVAVKNSRIRKSASSTILRQEPPEPKSAKHVKPTKPRDASPPREVPATSSTATPALAKDPHLEPTPLTATRWHRSEVMVRNVMEMAKDYISDDPSLHLVGGYFSLVSDAYSKPGLATWQHRVAMCEAGTQDSDWIMVDSWEARNPEYQRTAWVLDHFEEMLNGGKAKADRVRIMMLAGSDLIQSFAVPDLWLESDLDHILNDFGCLIIDRSGSDVHGLLLSSDTLHTNRHNVRLIKQHVVNDISSTKIRLFVKRGMSIRYLVPTAVAEYIRSHQLYQDASNSGKRKRVGNSDLDGVDTKRIHSGEEGE
ncbi:hypothetical protein HKX48_001931 [Thoreauomyces humboldtii]|nr:hypothetical protein HKX48_001931 [Thoreauomyces humboldtii]